MKSSARKIQLASYDDLFKNDEERLADTQERNGGCDRCHYDRRKGNGYEAGFEGGYYQEIFSKGIYANADAAGNHKAFGELVPKTDAGEGTVNCCHRKVIFDKRFGFDEK